MSRAWPHPLLGGAIEGVASGLVTAAGVARNVTSLAAPRQFFADVGLDVPTLMAAVVVFTFLVQFFFTVVSVNLAAVASSSALLSSSSSLTSTTTTTTTTAATTLAEAVTQGLRTQTVTPASAPAWRFYPRGPSGLQRLWRRSLDYPPFPVWHHVSRPRPTQPWVTPHYLGAARGSSDKARGTPSARVSPKDLAAALHHRTGPRRMPLLYEEEDAAMSGEALGMLDPITFTSHRVGLAPGGVEAGEPDAAEVMSGVLYGAERWGDRLQEWNILSANGAQALTQTVLMVRCAFISPDFCAKLDHYFRRQHDLNLVAAMMNHPSDYEDHEAWLAGDEQPGAPKPERENPARRQPEVGKDREVMHRGKVRPPVRRDRGGAKRRRPGELPVQGKLGAVGLVDLREPPKRRVSPAAGVGVRRKVKYPSSARPKAPKARPARRPAEKQDKRRVAGPVSVGTPAVSERTWAVYVVVMLATVVLVVVEAAHRILQFVTSSPGRALHNPHLDPLITLSAALHRWQDPQDSS